MSETIMRPYRSVWFNNERKWKMECPDDDVLQVGIKKAVGYIWRADGDYTGDLPTIQQTLNARGTITRCMPHEKAGGSILWAGDRDMIQSVVRSNESIFVSAGWDIDPERIFKRICETDVAHHKRVSGTGGVNKELYHAICDLFNSWCLFCCGASTWTDRNGNRLPTPLSAEPFDPDPNIIDAYPAAWR